MALPNISCSFYSGLVRRIMTTYHHVFDAVIEVRWLETFCSIGLLLIPIAKAVLAAWPEKRYATLKRVSITKQ